MHVHALDVILCFYRGDRHGLCIPHKKKHWNHKLVKLNFTHALFFHRITLCLHHSVCKYSTPTQRFQLSSACGSLTVIACMHAFFFMIEYFGVNGLYYVWFNGFICLHVQMLWITSREKNVIVNSAEVSVSFMFVWSFQTSSSSTASESLGYIVCLSVVIVAPKQTWTWQSYQYLIHVSLQWAGWPPLS